MAKIKPLSIILIALLCGCEKPMTNDEIIAETCRCKKAGMGVKIFHNKMSNGRVYRVECDPIGVKNDRK